MNTMICNMILFASNWNGTILTLYELHFPLSMIIFKHYTCTFSLLIWKIIPIIFCINLEPGRLSNLGVCCHGNNSDFVKNRKITQYIKECGKTLSKISIVYFPSIKMKE
jgi:hypothetical protein